LEKAVPHINAFLTSWGSADGLVFRQAFRPAEPSLDGIVEEGLPQCKIRAAGRDNSVFMTSEERPVFPRGGRGSH
jgi:hypothetical protein